MNIFGLTIARRKDAPAGLRSINDRRAWWPIIREANTGDWQRNLEARVEDAFQHAIAWACMTLIAGDIGKLRIRLVQSDANGVTTEISNPAYSPFLRKPNRYQNRIQFFEYWILSKLSRGNTYVLKARDSRGVVIAGYILDPSRVRVLVAVDGSVFYQLDADNLSGLPTSVVVPAREIFHDTMYTLYHPLVGVSPIYACGASVLQGLKIVANSSELFENGSQLSGVLTAPGLISQDNADRIREHWEQNFAGRKNAGKVAALGDGLKFEPMTMTAVDAQLIDQLKWNDEKICAAYHVPGQLVGVGGPLVQGMTPDMLYQQYYSQCLQELIEKIELTLDEGLGLADPLYTEFDIDRGLFRMDTASRMKTATDGIKGGVYTVNEGRRAFNLPPVTGGETVYLQEQDHSLQWLAERDAQGPPPLPPKNPAPALPPAPAPAKSLEADDDLAAELITRAAQAEFAEYLTT